MKEEAMVQTSKKSAPKKATASVVKKRKANAATAARKKLQARRAQAAKKPSSKLNAADQLQLAQMVDNPPAPTAAMLTAYARYQSLIA